MSVLASIDLQTLGDAFGLGAIYALMAVGIGLVFGVLRLVNFAYGQLIMAGAYTLAYTSGWPVAASIVSCFAVVVALSLAMDRVVFRPLRSSSPAVMLVTTFAIAFLLQAVALIIDLRDGQLGEVASSIAPLNQAVSVGGVDVRKVTFVAVGVAVGALIALALVLTRTTIGLHTRAAASDFRTARLLGVRANRVIAFAVVVSGLLAAAVAVLLTVQNPFVQPDFALEDTIIVLVGGLLATTASASNEVYFLNALVSVAIVVAIYVFVGISGVLSFGQISFVAVGAFAAGVMTVPVESKKGVLATIFPLLRDHSVGNVPSLLLAAALGGVFAFVVGMPLMRLSGLAAGIATFAVLEITHNVLREWTKIGPGATTLALVPETTDALQATLGALVAIVVAFLYQRSRRGRLLRASREDPAVTRSVGVNIHLERLLAFTVSGALAGFAGALYVHLLGSITTEQVYLELTFLTLAMLVIGGLTSLWGAVIGALAVSGLDSFLSRAEQSGVHVIFTFNLWEGTRLVFLATIMALVLIVRPSGLTGGREFRLRRR